ncbi:endonuclease/exonuclease/phosphatase family protein [Microterricola pindariensis]|uniref:endonuclease/exonuclease/phosphatase family protein n=1 Tax=Microterricola pindariensis TaxID=478010 RepID=UPI000CEBEB21|nr:endonuclease/exonuclease/phosphatase family protein [Microterricola pindariensis]
MIRRILSSLIALGAAVGLLVLAWPQLFGLQNTWMIAQIVSFRGVLVAASAVGIVLLMVIGILRPFRRITGTLAVLVLVFAVATSGILALRGAANGDVSLATNGADDSITVLSWNTRGEEPGVDAIVKLALESGADIVSLPETTDELGTEVAVAMKEGGRPMWVWTLNFNDVYKARSTALLISPDLGEYTLASAAGSGPPGNTNISPTVVATPVNGDGPTIIAVHAGAPTEGAMSDWRSDLDWLAEQCDAPNVIMAGDFNATLDHMAGRGIDGAALGRCADAALSAGSAALGTWPTAVPPLLGAPIDHVLATDNWRVDAFRVLDEVDDSGSDHRPLLTRYLPADG